MVMTSEVRVTRSRLNCSSRWAASATSAMVPRPTTSSACSRFKDFLSEADGTVGAPELDVGLCEVPVLLLDGANVGHHLGLESPDCCVGVQSLNHDIRAIGFEADGSGGGLSRKRSRPQEGLSQGELKVGGIGRGPDEERAVLVRPRDVVDDSDRSTVLGLLRESGLKTERVVHGDDGELGSGQGERSALHAVVEGLNGIAPEDAGGEGGIELGESRGDLGFLDGRVIHRLERAGTEGAGDTGGGTGVQGGRLEAADRDALGAEGDDADDFGVIQTDADGLLQLERPDLLRLRGRWSCAAWRSSAPGGAWSRSGDRPS